MPFPVSCFVIGAQKSGTTSLATMLDAHPQVCVSSPKEPLFFSKNYDRGVQWYENCFQNADRAVLVDASPDYSRGPTDMFPVGPSYDSENFQHIPGRIHEYNPEAKFIYIMRDPISRTYSSYWHNIRAGYETDSFEACVRESDRYLVASDYFGQLQNFLEFFTIDRFHFIIFENLIDNFSSELRRCCEFLNIDYMSAVSTEAVHKNASYQLTPTTQKIRKLFGSQRRFKAFSRSLKNVLPERAQTHLKKLTTAKIPKITQADSAYLTQLFSERNARLEQLTGLDLSIWKKQ
jgi:hypothetical protein